MDVQMLNVDLNSSDCLTCNVGGTAQGDPKRLAVFGCSYLQNVSISLYDF